MPDVTDDKVEIPVDASSVGAGGITSEKEPTMAAMPPKADTIDALIDKVTDQNFAKTMNRMDGYAEQYASQSAVVATAMNQMFGMAVQIVNATALNRIPSGTANQILEHNAAAGQPFNSPAAPKAA